MNRIFALLKGLLEGKVLFAREQISGEDWSSDLGGN
jgi:hypothetical protein